MTPLRHRPDLSHLPYLPDTTSMPIIRIDDAGDPRVADYRNVPDPELLHARGLFVAENRLVVRVLVESGRFRTRSVLVTDAAFASLQDVLLPRLDAFPIYVCPKSSMEPIAGYHLHRGCLALGERPAARTVARMVADAPDAARVVVLEAITNADNIGAIFRNARAFGVDAVVVGPRCCDPLYRKAIRVSIGATLVVPYATSPYNPAEAGSHVPDEQPHNPAEGGSDAQGARRTGPWQPSSAGLRREDEAGLGGDLLRLKEAGFTLVALTPDRTAIDLDDFAAAPRPPRIAILVGNEGEGLSAGAQAACDLRVRIPMAAGVDSLNASTATGIALYRLAGR